MPTTNKGTLISEGAYTYLRGDASTGRETWQLSKLAHGGLVLSSRIEMTSPQAAILTFGFEVTQHWAAVRFSARIDAGGKTLTSEQRVVGAQWQARIEPHGGDAQDLALDFTTQHELRFVSPLVLTPILFHSNLQVGHSREIDAIVIDSATLAPHAAKQKLTCAAEEKIEVPAGQFAAWRYTVDEDQFWADRNGVVLLYQATSGDTMKLARYRRIERR